MGARGEPQPITSGRLARSGAVIGQRWHVEELVGVGGTAAVYAASDRAGKRVALKILHPEYTHDSELQERLLFELLVTNRIPHPGCVQTYETVRAEEGGLALVMELLSGETLLQRLRRNGLLSLVDALRLVDRILEFLGLCHGAGFIHRDLKPSNVFLCSDGMLKIIDFGTARELSRRRTVRRLAIGTPAFMSPEQALGLSDAQDERTDVFGVGAILYELLSGRPMRPGGTIDEQVSAAARDAPPSIATIMPDLPDDVVYLVDRAIAWNRRDRWDNALHMRSKLQTIIERHSRLVTVPMRAALSSQVPTLRYTRSSRDEAAQG